MRTSGFSLLIIVTFVLGFGLGGLTLHVAHAEGLFGLTPTGLSASLSKIGTALMEMQKNVDALQQNMATVKNEKDQLASFVPDGVGKEGEGLRKMIPGFGR